MSVLICGSIAYDNIMTFPGRFKDHILPDKVHILNVAFLVPRLRREFGGCAGNVAYNYKLLGGKAHAMATIGQDSAAYETWLNKCEIDLKYITKVENKYTAQAYITTDLDDNQITAFHPGAMDDSHQNKVPTDDGISLGIISPDGKQGMIEHATQFHDAGIPFIFDPGQGLPMFDGDELKSFIEKANWVTVNDYEAEMLREKTGLSNDDIVQQVDAFIVTRGGEGSNILTKSETIEIPSARPEAINDPTGCGDAYRAGLLYGLSRNWEWTITARLGSLLGAKKIACHGTQNHTFDQNSIAEEFKTAFGMSIEF